MRIVHIAAGAGPMYCGACERDAALARGLIALGHDVSVIPLYTPLRLDHGTPLPFTPVFIGGINAFLQQWSPLFARLPGFARIALDRPKLLTWASGYGVRTQPKDLGAMTVSVLRGLQGRQCAEVARFIDFLRAQPRPDVFSITNSLLSGLAQALKAVFDVPIVCHLQGEESFVDGLPGRYRDEASSLIAQNSSAVDLFLATFVGNRPLLAEKFGIPEARIEVLRPGIQVEDFHYSERKPGGAATIGFLSSILPCKGLDDLVQAFVQLVLTEGRDVRMRIAGRNLSPSHLAQQKRRLGQANLLDRVTFDGELSFEDKRRFLTGIDIFVLPSRVAEARGIAVMEALACGRPVVIPNTGIFPEMIAETGGGVAFRSQDPVDLARVIGGLLDSPNERAAMGKAGATGVRLHYGAAKMAETAAAIYAGVVSGAIPKS